MRTSQVCGCVACIMKFDQGNEFEKGSYVMKSHCISVYCVKLIIYGNAIYMTTAVVVCLLRLHVRRVNCVPKSDYTVIQTLVIPGLLFLF